MENGDGVFQWVFLLPEVEALTVVLTVGFSLFSSVSVCEQKYGENKRESCMKPKTQSLPL